MVTETHSRFAEIDPDGVVHDLIDAGRTLPSSWYTDEMVFEAEQRLVFRRSWNYAGHRALVEEPGDFFTCDVGGVPVVIAHGADGQVRGFRNICRHRNHPVALGAGNRPLFQCFYHAWTYKLDGSFHAAPRGRSLRDKACDLALSSVLVEFFGDMVFVNVSGDAPSLREALGPIPALSRKRGYPIDTARFRASRTLEIAANWKIFWDNNCECYHCPTVHRSWAKTVKVGGEHIYSYPVGTFHFETYEDATATNNPDYALFGWPALCMVTPGVGGKVEAGEVAGHEGPLARNGYIMEGLVPVSVDSCRMEYDVYANDNVTDEQVEHWLDSAFSIVTEDKDVCERLQQSHASGAGLPGTLIPSIDSEYHTLVWQKLLHRALTEPSTPLYAPMLEPSETWPTDA